jgi:transposase
MVKAIPRSYTDEFKLEAVKLAQEVGVIETTRRLNIPESTLGNWLTSWKKQTLFKDGQPKAQPPAGSVAALQAEINRLRRENANLKVDVEILKKATAYFVKGSK